MFEKFPKIPRLYKDCVITEKIDGTNAQICLLTEEEAAQDTEWSQKHTTRVSDWLHMACGSRKRIILPNDDNFGFARWAWDHHEELAKLGPGRHFGEWWGRGIQRGYNLDEKRFSLFNVGRWTDCEEEGKEQVPDCCNVVPVLATGEFSSVMVEAQLSRLADDGSSAAPGYMQPEGVIVYHTAARQLFKATLNGDQK